MSILSYDLLCLVRAMIVMDAWRSRFARAIAMTSCASLVCLALSVECISHEFVVGPQMICYVVTVIAGALEYMAPVDGDVGDRRVRNRVVWAELRMELRRIAKATRSPTVSQAYTTRRLPSTRSIGVIVLPQS